MTGCLTYAQGHDLKLQDAAEITALELATSAVLAFAHDDTPGSDYNQQPYAARAAGVMGGILVVDALMALDVAK